MSSDQVATPVRIGESRWSNASRGREAQKDDVRTILRGVGLRPTLQRVALWRHIFSKGHRHLSAERLYDETRADKYPVSLATVYNCLRDFSEAGLLRPLWVEGGRMYYDTNVSEHYHFFIEGEGEPIDVDSRSVVFSKTPTPPDGYQIARVEVVLRVKKKL